MGERKKLSKIPLSRFAQSAQIKTITRLGDAKLRAGKRRESNFSFPLVPD